MGQGSPESSSQEGAARADGKTSKQVQRSVARTKFGRKYHLRTRHELVRVRNSGRRINVPLLRAWRIEGATTGPRVAIIVALYGNSVVARNRLRRRLWHIVRTEIVSQVTVVPFDMLLSVRPDAYSASFEALRASIRRAIAV